MRSDAIVLADFSFGSRAASVGLMRTPAAGSSASLADELTVMYVELGPLFGRTKFPTKVAPASRRIVSPGWHTTWRAKVIASIVPLVITT